MVGLIAWGVYVVIIGEVYRGVVSQGGSHWVEMHCLFMGYHSCVAN